jgi:hypothetical protein
MSHRLLLKSLQLNAIVISVVSLLVVLAFGSRLTIQAQTGGPVPSKTPTIRSTTEPPSPSMPRTVSQSGNNLGVPSEPREAVLNIQPSAPSPVPLASQSSWPKDWYTVAGSVFLPANSDYSYQYGNSGCLKSNSPGYWRASVNLPDGSVAKYLYINYKNDMYSANSTAYLTKYKSNGDYVDLASVNSRNYTTTNVGYFLDLSGEFTETIDNLQYSYTFIWSGSTTQRLCAVRVGYYRPSVFGVALPLVLKQP